MTLSSIPNSKKASSTSVKLLSVPDNRRQNRAIAEEEKKRQASEASRDVFEEPKGKLIKKTSAPPLHPSVSRLKHALSGKSNRQYPRSKTDACEEKNKVRFEDEKIKEVHAEPAAVHPRAEPEDGVDLKGLESEAEEAQPNALAQEQAKL